jgi:hypothetical protein
MMEPFQLFGETGTSKVNDVTVSIFGETGKANDVTVSNFREDKYYFMGGWGR